MSTETQGPIGPHHDEEAWLEARQEAGVGASEVAALFGAHPFMDERELYFQKVGEIDRTTSPDMERGRHLEEPAAQLYARETGREIRRMPMRAHPSAPLFATLDRQILAGDGHPTAGLEVKVPRWQTFAKLRREGIPLHWMYQAEAQMAVTGYPFIAFGIFNADAWKLIPQDYFPIEGLRERIEDKVGEWWEAHIVAGVPPAPKIEQVQELPEIPVNTEIVTRDDPAWMEAVQIFKEAAEVLDEARALDKMARDQLKELLRDANQRVAEGAGVRAYLNQRPGRKSFQAKELEKVGAVDPVRLVKVLQVEHQLPLSVAQAIVEACAYDLETFYKQGKGYEELRPYILKNPEG